MRQLQTDAHGRFEISTVVAEAHPIPTEGFVGDSLLATQRSAWRPAHLHFRISAEGYEILITHLFRRGDPHLDSDPVFGVRPIVDWQPQADRGCLVEFDFVLAQRQRACACPDLHPKLHLLTTMSGVVTHHEH